MTNRKQPSRRALEDAMGRVDPSELEAVKNVYGKTVYLLKERRQGTYFKMYEPDGRRKLVFNRHKGRTWYSQALMHPDNIMTPDTPPMMNDYVQLLDKDGKPCENHTTVFTWTANLGIHLWLIEDMRGESFAVTRVTELDNTRRRGWQQVITATA